MLLFLRFQVKINKEIVYRKSFGLLKISSYFGAKECLLNIIGKENY